MNTVSNSNLQQHLSILGAVMRDKVTGITGMVDSICFDAYGCVQGSLRPKVKEDGVIVNGHWFDVKRLEPVDGQARIMEAPFVTPVGTEAGPADKPARGI